MNESALDYATPDPLAPSHADFDWPALERLLNETELDIGAERFRELSEGWVRLSQWCLGDAQPKPGFDANVGRRFLSLIWVVNPALLGGLSLHEIASALGVTAQSLSRRTAQISRRWGIVNRAQAHGWNRKGASDEP